MEEGVRGSSEALVVLPGDIQGPDEARRILRPRTPADSDVVEIGARARDDAEGRRGDHGDAHVLLRDEVQGR